MVDQLEVRQYFLIFWKLQNNPHSLFCSKQWFVTRVHHFLNTLTLNTSPFQSPNVTWGQFYFKQLIVGSQNIIKFSALKPFDTVKTTWQDSMYTIFHSCLFKFLSKFPLTWWGIYITWYNLLAVAFANTFTWVNEDPEYLNMVYSS